MAEVNTRQAPKVKERQRSEKAKQRKSPPEVAFKEEKVQDGSSLPNMFSHENGQSPNTKTVNGLLAAELLNGDHGREREPLFSGPRNRMPYFRWLGPTAIMPGFKQMVVKVKRQESDVARSSTDGGVIDPSLGKLHTAEQRVPTIYSNTPAAVESDVRTPLNLPFYDTSPMPPSELITHLANTFFTHLGCNYPFLQRKRFLRDLEEKQVDAILVDAVCALGARFSTHALLTQQPHDDTKSSPAEYGHAFAQRAKMTLIDAFPCPSVAAVQAALLLAYNEFGESRDSGLWMYLGIAIRMAQDLGMHKLEGLKYKGMNGPTPKMVKRESLGGSSTIVSPAEQAHRERPLTPVTAEMSAQETQKEIHEQKAVEQERVDTFWSVFFLDRVVSSGTGRRSTLRDKDIELSFPSLEETDPKTGWPAPFPALIRIVHLYGRVADVLNSVKEPSDVTSETPKRLAAMESQVTQFYQGLSLRLRFDAVNFQHYMKAGEGTNFVLLHFWFHTLIVLLHQPTLLKAFEGHMLQLFPNSQQLSMSSAKTIADILSYSQLMDAKASLGNPFTTQPIYIAACAFLKETAEQTATSNAQSRANSPTTRDANSDSGPSTTGSTPQSTKRTSISNLSSGKRTPTTAIDQKTLAKHTLLATAASQHYQLCYKALQSLETYWAGTKYILTVLDQKFEGVGDPLLYTVEEGESAMERPKPEPAFTSPGWRRKQSWGQYLGNPVPFFRPQGLGQVPGGGSPKVDPSQAIGWTLTGTMNSPSTNLACHFASGAGSQPNSGRARVGISVPPEIDPALMRLDGLYSQHTHAHSDGSQPNPSRVNFPNTTSGVSAADADLLLGLGSPYPPHNSGHQTPGSHTLTFSHQGPSTDLGGSVSVHTPTNLAPPPLASSPFFGQLDARNFGDVMIESQDVDMSMLGLEMMPWFDSYPPHDLNMSLFGPGGGEGDAQGGAQQQQQLGAGAQG